MSRKTCIKHKCKYRYARTYDNCGTCAGLYDEKTTEVGQLGLEAGYVEWLSVKDDLPDEGVICLVATTETSHGFEYVPQRAEYKGYWRFIDADVNRGDAVFAPTHWMKMIKPPQST